MNSVARKQQPTAVATTIERAPQVSYEVGDYRYGAGFLVFVTVVAILFLILFATVLTGLLTHTSIYKVFGVTL